MRQQTPHPPKQQFRIVRRHRTCFLVKIDASIVAKKEGKEKRQKAALQSERKVKNKQTYGANERIEHGEAVRTVRSCLLVTYVLSLIHI